jgi:hypothetical protein
MTPLFASEQRELHQLLQIDMIQKIAPVPDMMIDDVMIRWPAPIRVFWIAE